MRTTVRVGLLTLLFVVAQESMARPAFTVPSARPDSIEEVVSAIRGPLEGEEPDPKRHLPLYLEETQCGGWSKDVEVGGYIATVRGLPGRPHDWEGDVRSGMGVRLDSNSDGDPDNDYEFPDTTEGLATACEKGRDRINKEILTPLGWRETMDGWVMEYGPEWQEYAYPYFEDPPCQWRIKVGAWPPEPLNRDEFFQFDKDGWEDEAKDSCADFCGYLNSFYYRDCLEPARKDVRIFDGVDGDGNDVWHWENIQSCDREGFKYICTDQEVEDEDRRAACDAPHDDVVEWANARKCVGRQCRCPNEQDPDACLWTKKDENAPKQEYQSYYRLYPYANYSRDPLNDDGNGNDIAPRDVNSKELPTTCFGFYDEFDPKTHRTEDKDRRCVINVNVEDMRETQKGKAEYKEKNVEDRDPTDKKNQRAGGPEPGNKPPPPGAAPVPGEFNKFVDTWYKKLGGAFSFVNEKLFEERYDKDLGNVYLAYDELDDGELRATPQINDEKLFADSNLMRAFDDTGNPRAYVRWWQAQQSAMNALMRPPVLRIILPSAWFMGLDPNDPFLTAQSGAKDAAVRANRSDRIELQVEADEDMVGTALAYVERSVLLHVEEEPLPVVVPMGSPAEFRARAADWCNWYKSDEGVKTCDGAPQPIKDIMERLEEYADRIDEYRELRAELSLSAGAVLDLQGRLLEPIATWFKDHEQQLKDIVRGRTRTEAELLPLWRQAQQQIALLHEKSNLPWCMNQRFTSPTYSMLDPWLRSRRAGEQNDVETSELGMPLLPDVERPRDVIIDFSAVAAMSGTLKIPVLKPVQIRIEIPSPPEPAELPELPPIADIRAAVADAIGNMPEVRNELQEPPSMEPPAPLPDAAIDEARAALVAIADVAKGINERYEKFWKSIGPLKPLDPKAADYTEQLEAKRKKEEMRCKDWNEMPCEHVEMDLMERAQRIGSRPLVQLKQDFESVGTKRTEPTNCLPEDDACHILNAEQTDPGFRWEVRGSSANDVPIDELKLTILKLTQPPPIGTVDRLLLQPYDDDPSPLQSFPPIRLTP